MKDFWFEEPPSFSENDAPVDKERHQATLKTELERLYGLRPKEPREDALFEDILPRIVEWEHDSSMLTTLEDLKPYGNDGPFGIRGRYFFGIPIYWLVWERTKASSQQVKKIPEFPIPELWVRPRWRENQYAWDLGDLFTDTPRHRLGIGQGLLRDIAKYTENRFAFNQPSFLILSSEAGEVYVGRWKGSFTGSPNPIRVALERLNTCSPERIEQEKRRAKAALNGIFERVVYSFLDTREVLRSWVYLAETQAHGDGHRAWLSTVFGMDTQTILKERIGAESKLAPSDLSEKISNAQRLGTLVSLINRDGLIAEACRWYTQYAACELLSPSDTSVNIYQEKVPWIRELIQPAISLTLPTWYSELDDEDRGRLLKKSPDRILLLWYLRRKLGHKPQEIVAWQHSERTRLGIASTRGKTEHERRKEKANLSSEIYELLKTHKRCTLWLYTQLPEKLQEELQRHKFVVLEDN